MTNKLMKINLKILLFIAVFIFAVSAAQAQTINPPDAKMSLSAAQLETIKDIRAKAAREAVPTALRLAATIKQIYTNMLADKPDAKLRARLSKQMTDNTVKLLLIKGQSIREMVNALTPEQKRMLKSEMEKPGAPADLSELMEHIFNVPKQ